MSISTAGFVHNVDLLQPILTMLPGCLGVWVLIHIYFHKIDLSEALWSPVTVSLHFAAVDVPPPAIYIHVLRELELRFHRTYQTCDFNTMY